MNVVVFVSVQAWWFEEGGRPGAGGSGGSLIHFLVPTPGLKLASDLADTQERWKGDLGDTQERWKGVRISFSGVCKL